MWIERSRQETRAANAGQKKRLQVLELGLKIILKKVAEYLTLQTTTSMGGEILGTTLQNIAETGFEEMTNRLLKPREMADALSVSERTLQKWRSVGTGPDFIKLGTAKNAQVRYPSVQKIAELKSEGNVQGS